MEAGLLADLGRVERGALLVRVKDDDGVNSTFEVQPSEDVQVALRRALGMSSKIDDVSVTCGGDTISGTFEENGMRNDAQLGVHCEEGALLKKLAEEGVVLQGFRKDAVQNRVVKECVKLQRAGYAVQVQGRNVVVDVTFIVNSTPIVQRVQLQLPVNYPFAPPDVRLVDPSDHLNPALLRSLLTPTDLELADAIDETAYAAYTAPSQDWPIYVKTLTGDKLTIPASPQMTVAQVMLNIRDSTGIPCPMQQFVFAGHLISGDPTCTLQAAGIQKDSTLHMITGRIRSRVTDDWSPKTGLLNLVSLIQNKMRMSTVSA